MEIPARKKIVNTITGTTNNKPQTKLGRPFMQSRDHPNSNPTKYSTHPRHTNINYQYKEVRRAKISRSAIGYSFFQLPVHKITQQIINRTQKETKKGEKIGKKYLPRRLINERQTIRLTTTSLFARRGVDLRFERRSKARRRTIRSGKERGESLSTPSGNFSSLASSPSPCL